MQQYFFQTMEELRWLLRLGKTKKAQNFPMQSLVLNLKTIPWAKTFFSNL